MLLSHYNNVTTVQNMVPKYNIHNITLVYGCRWNNCTYYISLFANMNACRGAILVMIHLEHRNKWFGLLFPFSCSEWNKLEIRTANTQTLSISRWKLKFQPPRKVWNFAVFWIFCFALNFALQRTTCICCADVRLEVIRCNGAKNNFHVMFPLFFI